MLNWLMLRPLLIFSQSDYFIQEMANSADPDQLKKPTDLEPHCLQKQGISGLSRTMFNDTKFSPRIRYYPQCIQKKKKKKKQQKKKKKKKNTHTKKKNPRETESKEQKVTEMLAS